VNKIHDSTAIQDQIPFLECNSEKENERQSNLKRSIQARAEAYREISARQNRIVADCASLKPELRFFKAVSQNGHRHQNRSNLPQVIQ
jgi:hypothetical protein